MNEEDRQQLDIIYDYMKKNKKALKLKIRCKMCKENFTRSEFYTSTKVCKSHWMEYVGLIKKEKKELNND